jgi:hypothetical protein
MNSTDDMKRALKELEEAINSTPLNRTLVLDLIQRGADPNFQEKPDRESFFSEQLLSWSEPPISLEAVEVLLEGGADPNHDPGNGMRPLYNACMARRPDVVAILLRHGADPNFIIEEHESLLDDVDFDRWVEESDIGTAWEKDYHQGSVKKLGEILEILKAAGAKPMHEMIAAALADWVHLAPGSPERLLTRTGYISLDDIAGLADEWQTKWRDWCARNFRPGRNESTILDTPAGFNRRAYNQEGLELARTFKALAGGSSRVDLFLIDPDDEEAFAINCHQIKDVGGVEKHPSLPYPFSNCAKNPGFHLDTKAAVAADLSAVEVVCEFFVCGERYHPELRLNFAELERSADGDGRYTIFSDTENREIAVDVLWGSDSVLWRVALTSGKEELAFLREKYAEVIQDAKKSIYYTDRRARVAIEQFQNRAPTLTCTGHIQLAGPASLDSDTIASSYSPTSSEADLASRSRIWEICVLFAAAVNLRESGILAPRMAEHVCFTGDRRPGIDGREAVLNYLRVAFNELKGRKDVDRVQAEVGHFWLTGEPCVLLWEGGEAVAFANVRSNSERMLTSCHWMTERGLVESVKGMRVFPALTLHDHLVDI